MKALITFSAATLMLAASVNAQTIEASVKNDIASLNKQESVIKKEKKEEKKEIRTLKGTEVSYQAEQQFMQDFGNINVTRWERTPEYDKAVFTKDGQTMYAYYDIEAKLIGTTMDKVFADIPANAQKYIDSKYRGYSKAGVVFFDDNEFNDADMILYNQPFEDADNYFVDLQKDNKEIIVRVNMNGDVSFFKQLKY
ncbi:MAG: hypothetical protein ABI675_12855 [Chitinophagaceae bacterium]